MIISFLIFMMIFFVTAIFLNLMELGASMNASDERRPLYISITIGVYLIFSTWCAFAIMSYLNN